jgi:hypothetical protein
MTWWDRIAAAEARFFGTDCQPAFTYEDKEAASDWVTCACGEQDARIPREPGLSRRPADDALADLGMDFYAAVIRQDPFEARAVLVKIEHRVAEILAELATAKILAELE